MAAKKSVISAPNRSVRYQEATSADVPAMARSRAEDAEAGPADARMARYLDGTHHPQRALPPRTAFVALQGDDVIGYIAGHATTRHLPPGSVSVGSEPVGSETTDSDPNYSGRRGRHLRYPTPASGPTSNSDAAKGFACEGEVQYLYVAPGARRRGVARQLLRLLARWFDERGIRRVCVNADVESAGAAPFYIAARARPLNVHWYVWDDIRTVSSPEDHI
jgi:GNAT superfamily N-acetyltransferase